MVLDGYVAFQDDYLAHVTQGSCTANFKSVPCVGYVPPTWTSPGTSPWWERSGTTTPSV